jgi:hypothetical protein
MKTFFYIDGNEFRGEMGTETYLLGEVSDNHIVLHKAIISGDIALSEHFLKEAIEFAFQNGYAIVK